MVVFLCDVRSVFAAGTTAGTLIGNQATVNFKVGGTSQPPVSNATTTFLVDRKINLTVAQVGGSVSVAPGSSDQVMAFTVTNTSNASLDFGLSATNDANPADDFDPTNIRVFVDSNGNGTYEPATDTSLFLDEIPADAVRTVFVVSNIPVGQINAQTAGITLTATAKESGTPSSEGLSVTQTVGADTQNAVDTVFADGAGDTDGVRDGKHSDDNIYTVLAAGITVLKTATIISDPFNGTSSPTVFPKAIPGAVIEYCIQVQNPAGGATATDVTVTDPVPVNTTFVSGSIFAGGTVTGAVCNADGTPVSDASGFSATPTPTVTTTVLSVVAGTTVTSRFRVTIN